MAEIGLCSHDSIQTDLIMKILFNEHKHILEWECPNAFRPYRLVSFSFQTFPAIYVEFHRNTCIMLLLMCIGSNKASLFVH